METLNKDKRWTAFIMLIAAILLAIILIPIGLIYSFLIMPYFVRKKKNIVQYLKDLLYSIYVVITDICYKVALYLDILGNVLIGDFIELFVTKERDTLFGNREHTISQALGYLQVNGLLTSFGCKFVKLIDSIFGKGHCKNAYLG